MTMWDGSREDAAAGRAEAERSLAAAELRLRRQMDGVCRQERRALTRAVLLLGLCVVLPVVALLVGCGTSVQSGHKADTTQSPRTNPNGLITPVPSPQQVPTGKQGVPRGNFPSHVDSRDATAVSKAFARASCLSDTRLDVSPFDAPRRAARWATPAYAGKLSQPGVQPGGAVWQAMAAHHGYTTVTAVPNQDDGRPADQLRRARRAWSLTITGHGDGGWTGQSRQQVMYVTLTRAGGQAPWRVAGSHVAGGGHA